MARLNRYRAKKPLGKADSRFLQKTGLFGMVILVVLSLSGGTGTAVQRYTDHILSAILPSTVVELTNTERGRAELPELSRCPVLDEAARLKAEHMIEEQYFAHFSPKDNISPWHWFRKVGYEYAHAGENLAIYFNNSKEVVEAWMESPLHRDNILKERYTEIGVAALEGVYEGHQTIYVVQLFGTPASLNAEIASKAEPPLYTETDWESHSVQGESTENTELRTNDEKVPVIEEVLTEKADKDSVESDGFIKIDTVSAGEGFAYVSEHFATSSPGLPVAMVGSGPSDPSSTETWLRLTYIFLATFIGLSLLSSFVISFFYQAYRQMVYGFFLLAILLSEIYIHFQYILN